MLIQLTDSDNGKTITAKADDIVVLTLAWKPSSGYFWQSTDVTAGEVIEIKHSGEDTTPGASVYVAFKIKIKQTGIIEFLYARPWSETQPPNKWFVINVTV